MKKKMPRLPIGSLQVHDGFAETTKLGPLEWFAHAVSNQIVGWTMLHFQSSVLNVVFDEAVTNVDVA